VASRIDTRWLVGALLALACRKTPSMDPSNDSTTLRPTAPAVALGPHFVTAAFAPGRYATAIQRTLQGTHAMQLVVEDSTASFVLDLAADGAATACRGWRYNLTNDGPEIQTDERFRDQQGYRGRYSVAAGIAVVQLGSDPAVCPVVRESALELRRASAIELRCVLAVPRDHPALSAPVLLCQWLDATTNEPAAHEVAGLAPDGWFVLGSGNGLRVRMTGKPEGAHEGDPTKIVATPASSQLGTDAWERSF